MHRSMRNRLAMLLAAAAFAGVTGTTQAGPTATQYQLVQQTDQSQSATDRAADQVGSAADRAGTAMGSAADRATGQAGSQMGQSGNQAQAALPQGITPKDYGNVRGDVRDTFSALAKAALNRDSFNDLRDQLAKADRDRLATNDNKYPDDLNRAIDQFNQAWRGRYNASFSIDKDSAYPDQFLAVTTGEVTNPQQVDHWPVSPQGQQAAPQTSNPTMNQGTGVAVASFTGQPGQPPLHVSLVREGRDWKIDIPDAITADQLKESLARHLSEVTNMQNQWPQDQYQAQRIVTSHIIMALYNLQSGQGGQSGQSGQMGSSGSPSTSGQSGQMSHQSGSQSQSTSQNPGSQSQEGQSGQTSPQGSNMNTSQSQSGSSQTPSSDPGSEQSGTEE